ncbi:hypothetical protein M514_05647 [Trichuris suis]|uniref:Small-subunit processome Utp12 domain-containing protein n=1 Tax=Trichuris suis TaxID=68888 RepID=A0A085NQP0_9BILA|nr:hypothetical protein M513_05647 [Trichuris suis]KFD71786.1 hypothetical protein M514_05647 [Trichuris suis]
MAVMCYSEDGWLVDECHFYSKIYKDSSYSTTKEPDLQELKIDTLLENNGLLVIWFTNNERVMRYACDNLLPSWHMQIIGIWHWLKMLLTTPGIDDIKRVAESIPKAAILPFISLLAVRLRSDDVPRLQLLLWLKHVLAAHTDFFAANPNHIAEVADIFPFLNSDLPSLESVLKLVGRFQLLTEFGNPAETSEREASSNNSDKRQVTSSAETTNDLLSTTNLWSELREPELWNRLEATEVYGYTDEDEPVEQESEREHEKKNSRRRDADVREKIHKRKRRIHSDA